MKMHTQIIFPIWCDVKKAWWKSEWSAAFLQKEILEGVWNYPGCFSTMRSFKVVTLSSSSFKSATSIFFCLSFYSVYLKIELKWEMKRMAKLQYWFFLVFLQKILNLLIRILCTQTVCIIQWFFFGKMSSIKCLNHMKKQLFLRIFLLRQNVAEKVFLL